MLEVVVFYKNIDIEVFLIVGNNNILCLIFLLRRLLYMLNLMFEVLINIDVCIF